MAETFFFILINTFSLVMPLSRVLRMTWMVGWNITVEHPYSSVDIWNYELLEVMGYDSYYEK